MNRFENITSNLTQAGSNPGSQPIDNLDPEKNQERKSKIFFFIGAALVVGGVAQYLFETPQEAPLPPTEDQLAPVAEQAGDPYLSPPHLSEKGDYWENPRLSWFDWLFCRGRRRSTFCSDNTQHPWVDPYKKLGMELPFEDLPSDKTVADTLTIK